MSVPPGGSVDSPELGAPVGLQVLFGQPSQISQQLTEDDRKKARMVYELFQKAKKWKLEQGGENWQRWWDFWRGKQWQKRRPRNLSMAVINEVYSALETFIGHFSEDLPETVVLPRKLEGESTAEMLAKLLNWAHDINEFDTEIELPIRSAAVTGTGVRRIDWDPSMDKWRGAPRYGFLDENYFFPAPHTRNVEEAAYIIEAKNIPVMEVRKRWEAGAKVQAGTWDSSLTPVSGNNAQTGEPATFTLPDGSSTQQSKSQVNRKDRDLCTLVEAWIRQDDGTLRYIVIANGIVLQDGPSPYKDEAYPYVVYNVIRNKASIFGFSLVEQLEGMQRELNEIHSYALDQQKYESDSPLVVRVENLEEGKVFSNAAGSVYVDRSQGGQGYYNLTKPGANPKWFEIEANLRDRIRGISGGVDILHGERPVGVTTLGGMEIIRQQANVIVTKMTKHIKAAVRNEDIKAIDRMGQFFKDERVVRVTGEKGKSEFVSVNERTQMGIDGEWATKNSIPEDFECDVDFSVVPPGGFDAKFQRAMAMRQLGVVDDQYVLEAIDEDSQRIEQVVARKQQQAQAEAAAAAQAQGMPPPGGQQPDPQDLEQQVLSMFGGM